MINNKPLSNYKIKKIMEAFCVDIPALHASFLLKINRNSINKYYNIFREIIFDYQTAEKNKFCGEIELDESYFGAKRVKGFAGKLKRGRGTLKQPVFGIFERNGQVYTEIVPNCTKRTLQSIILGKISIESVINTDGWRGYNGLVDVGYDKHFRVNHGKNEFSNKNGVHVNGIESFWSFTKRRLAKFNGVKQNFELHLKESEWRWSKNTKMLINELNSMYKNYKKNLAVFTKIC
jgi:transposase-like protein